MKEKWQSLLPYALMLVFALTRWPGMLPENFSAAYGLAFCAGVYFTRRMAWWLPLTALFVTDLALNGFYYHVPLIGTYMLGTYAAYAVLIWLGRNFTPKASWLVLLGGGLAGALIFYFVTNTLSWLTDPLYPKNLAGWIQALTVGTPNWPHTWEFFRNTLTSGGLFTGLFAGAMKLGEAAEAETEEESADEEEPAPEESKA